MKRIKFVVPLLFLLFSGAMNLQVRASALETNSSAMSEIPWETVHNILVQCTDVVAISYNDLLKLYKDGQLGIEPTDTPHQYHVRIQMGGTGVDIVILDGM